MNDCPKSTSANRQTSGLESLSNAKVASIVLIIVALAGCLRFMRLGDFPFSGDETATLAESDSFIRPTDGPVTSPTDRLPRLIPLAYLVHLIDYQLFGRDEFGSRVLMALFGTIGTAIVGFGLIKSMDSTVAISTALLITVWPEHLFQSQQNRFYMTAWLLATSCIVAGAQAIHNQSTYWMIASCACGLAAIFVHTIELLLLPGLFVAVIAASLFQRQPVPRLMLTTIALAFVLATVLLGLHFYRIGQNWNLGETWGYSPLRSMLASVIQIGWPIFMLACFGGLLIWRDRNPQAGYWISWTLLWLIASAALPFFVVYHPGYVFPLTLGIFVLAGYAVARIALVLCQSKVISTVWILIAACLQLPSTVSYYMDGSRHDFRVPAQFIDQHWQAGDRIAAISPKLLEYYLPVSHPVTNLYGDSIKNLNELNQIPGRIWIVLPFGRAGHDEKLQRWLGSHTTPELTVRQPRLDYYDFSVSVFLVTDQNASKTK